MTLKGWKMQTGKQRKPQEMKGNRGDVADRHMLAAIGVYCVCADAGASCSIVLPHTGAHEWGTDSVVWGKGGVHTYTHTLWQESKAFSSPGYACLLLCVSLIRLNHAVAL